MGHSARSTVPPPHPPLQSASEGIGNKKKNGERFWMGKLKGFRLR